MMPSAPIWSEFGLRPYPCVPAGALRTDVAVIGGGLTGLSAAYHLLDRRPGARVVVLEARRLGAGASGRTTGMFGPGVGQSLLALVRRHGPERAAALYRATLSAVDDVARLVDRERIACELALTGQLIIAPSAAARRRLAGHASMLERLGLPGETLDDGALDRAIRLVRAGRDEPGPAALRLPRAGTLHPLKLLAGLADRVTARGGTIFEGARVVGIGRGRPVALDLTDGGRIVTDEVVVATGADTPALGLLRGRIIPLRLQVLVTEPLVPCGLETLGWAGREGVLDARRIFSYFRLTSDDRVVFGGDSPRYGRGDGDEDGASAASALARLTEELQATFGPEARLRVAGGWTGVIDYVLDALPAIQRARGRPAVVHAVGWCGHGIALSIASGAWVARVLCDGAVPEDLPWYRDDPPLVPTRAARWLAVRAATGAMTILDRLA